MTVQEIPRIHADLRRSADAGALRPYAARVAQLKALRRLLIDREAELAAAMTADLGKSRFEGWTSETAFTRSEVDHALKHLADWMRPERVPTPLAVQPAACEVVRDPLGLVLILGAWNYPVQLTLGPLVAALSAGNCALVKPSELAPRSSEALATLLPAFLDKDLVRVVEGGVPESTALLEQRWDHILYTGGENVARIVLAAAAKHLTPVTLELGGKSPAIVDSSIDLGLAARRIARGKYWNAGQTCIAPDYVLVERSRHDAFVDTLKKTVAEFFGDDASSSPDYARIVNERHMKRLLSYLPDGTVVFGGDHDEATRYIAPTALTGVDPDRRVMQDEIFGPILPILPVDSMDAAISFINSRAKPLALYLFSTSRRTQDAFVGRTTCGGMAVNETLLHVTNPDLPFGGVGNSGMGAYHGRWGFETFSHRKSVMNRSTLDVPLFYPPFVDWKQKVARRLM
jgi:aldehyde dehydrogenase (NAD+)